MSLSKHLSQLELSCGVPNIIMRFNFFSAQFQAVLTDSGDCGVQLSSSLDADSTDSLNYLLTLELKEKDGESLISSNVTAKVS